MSLGLSLPLRRAVLFTDRAPCPCGLLTSALRSIPPVVCSLTSFALRCGLAGQLGIASPLSGKLPEARLFTPCTGVVQFHSPQTSTQTVWMVTPGVAFGLPRLGTVVKQQRKRAGWAPRKLQRPTPRSWSRAIGPSPPVLVMIPSLTRSSSTTCRRAILRLAPPASLLQRVCMLVSGGLGACHHPQGGDPLLACRVTAQPIPYPRGVDPLY